MDVNGAKVLQRRLDPNRSVQTATASVVVPADAPPVYHWVGVARTPAEARPSAPEDAPDDSRPSWRRRLGLGSR
jgi:hypothetical protein